VAPPTPKPVPPVSARPTPPARVPAAPPASKKPTLQPTDKIAAFAEAAGMSVDDYLLRLEERGVPQSQIEALSMTREQAPTRRRTIYG